MRKITVTNTDQPNYTYILTERPGTNFHPEFKPHLTPQEMLELGVFGGFYFGDDYAEFPKSWLKNARLSADHTQRKELNYYGVLASQSLSVWQAKGWVHHDDPKGWFQWYCRYYLGRRHQDDGRQIKRWKAILRHATQIAQNCIPQDQHCRPRQRQAILHWAYDPRRL